MYYIVETGKTFDLAVADLLDGDGSTPSSSDTVDSTDGGGSTTTTTPPASGRTATDLLAAADAKFTEADEKLKAVFGGKSKVSMFEMTKLVSNHLK